MEIAYFPRQQGALDFSAAHGDLPVFALDRGAGRDGSFRRGSKKYLSASYEAFERMYVLAPEVGRHFYEVLVWDRKTDAYLDLEYMKDANPGRRGKEGELREQIESDLVKYFAERGVSGRPVFHWAFSSSEWKFSAHVRIALESAAFEGPKTVGIFLQDFLKSERYSCNDEDGERTSLVDPSVYTPNRVFRLPQSSKKLGPGANEYGPLMIAEAVLLDTFRSARESSRGLDMRGFAEMCLQRHAAHAENVISCDSSESTLSNKPDVPGLLKRGRNEISTEVPGRLRELAQKIIAHIRAVEPWRSDAGMNLAANSYTPGRHMLFFRSSSLHCKQKGSPHKSNHVFFRAVPLSGYFQQGCFDGEGGCRPAESEDCAGAPKSEPRVRSALTTWSEPLELPAEICELAKRLLLYADVPAGEDPDDVYF